VSKGDFLRLIDRWFPIKLVELRAFLLDILDLRGKPAQRFLRNAVGEALFHLEEQLRDFVGIAGPGFFEFDQEKRKDCPGLPPCSIGDICPSSNDLRLFGLWKIGVSGSDFGLI